MELLGYFCDLREAGETCSKHRVERIMRLNKIVALHGYRVRHYTVGKPSVLIPNLVKRQFNVEKPNRVWVTDITYIRTWEGWLYPPLSWICSHERSLDGRRGLPYIAAWSWMP